MKWKESNTVFRPSRFSTSQFWLQAFVIFALLSIGFSDNSVSTTISSFSAISIPIDEKPFSQKYNTSNEDDPINFVLHAPDEKCYGEDDKKKPSFKLILSDYESLVIEWKRYEASVGKEISVSIYAESKRAEISKLSSSDKDKLRKLKVYIPMPESDYLKLEDVDMSIPRGEGNNSITLIHPFLKEAASTTKASTTKDGSPKFHNNATIVNPFKLTLETTKEFASCGMSIICVNCKVYVPPPPPTKASTTTASTTTTSTSGDVSTTTSNANSKKPAASGYILGLKTWIFILIICVSALVVLLIIAGILVYCLWWRKRKAAKENDIGPVPVGMKPETWQKIKNMKPKEFPLTEKQKQIKAGAMADDSEYPTTITEGSGYGPVQKTEIADLKDKKKKKEEETQTTSHSATTKTNDKSTKTSEKSTKSSEKSTKSDE